MTLLKFLKDKINRGNTRNNFDRRPAERTDPDSVQHFRLGNG